MKKILFSISLFGLCAAAHSQTVKASLDTGASKLTFKIFLLADAAQTPATISTLQFNVGVDTTALPVAPTLTILSVNNTTLGLGTPGSWTINPAYKEGAYWQYNISTTTSPLTSTFASATDTVEAMELKFTNGDVLNAVDITKVALVTLPDGGAAGGALFYCTGTISSNGLSQLYFAKNGSGVSVDNQPSYDPINGNPGTGTSVASIPLVVVPVKFVNFTAVKNKNSALLKWSVENEDANTAYYEIQKSATGVDFSSYATVPVNANGHSANTYTSMVDNLSSGLVYFRIKQVDKDGRFVYTQVKSVRIDGKNLTAVPNPVKTTTTVSFELANNENVIVALTDASGKQVSVNQIQGFKGANTTKVDMSKFATGNYTLKVQTATDVQVISIVKASN